MNDNDNNNTEMKERDMRTTTINDLRPISRFANRNAVKLNVDFNAGRSAVLPVHIVATREYLRDLRAAEMRVWEQSGGDYLLSE
jgi:hypothetical protein